MKFKGTIIITDPCYIIKDREYEELSSDLKYPQYNDYEDNQEYLNDLQKYNEKYREFDDWKRCDYGDNMEVLGITTYISENTLYGDWGCTTYTSKNPKGDIDYISDYYQNNDDGEGPSVLLGECKDLGSFCADAGMVGVFLLDEVLKYNPDFKTWIDEHPWCVTTIPDFDGDVEYYIDSSNEAHIIGNGNINFMTLQTSL